MKNIKKIAFLAPFDSYSGIVAEFVKKKYSNAVLVSCSTLPKVIESVCEDTIAVVPIENSREGLVGTVIDTLYSLPSSKGVYVWHEYIHKIEHRLFALDGVTLEDIEMVATHPEAYKQVASCLSDVLPNAVIRYTQSTSGALDLLNESTAVIAGTHVSRGGVVVLNNLDGVGLNSTKFWVLGSSERAVEENSFKSTIVFAVPHKPGGLVAILNILDRHKINMVGIASRPTKSGEWTYYFIVDMECTSSDKIVEALREVEEASPCYKCFGRYTKL